MARPLLPSAWRTRAFVELGKLPSATRLTPDSLALCRQPFVPRRFSARNDLRPSKPEFSGRSVRLRALPECAPLIRRSSYSRSVRPRRPCFPWWRAPLPPPRAALGLAKRPSLGVRLGRNRRRRRPPPRDFDALMRGRSLRRRPGASPPPRLGDTATHFRAALSASAARTRSPLSPSPGLGALLVALSARAWSRPPPDSRAHCATRRPASSRPASIASDREGRRRCVRFLESRLRLATSAAPLHPLGRPCLRARAVRLAPGASSARAASRSWRWLPPRVALKSAASRSPVFPRALRECRSASATTAAGEAPVRLADLFTRYQRSASARRGRARSRPRRRPVMAAMRGRPPNLPSVSLDHPVCASRGGGVRANVGVSSRIRGKRDRTEPVGACPRREIAPLRVEIVPQCAARRLITRSPSSLQSRGRAVPLDRLSSAGSIQPATSPAPTTPALRRAWRGLWRRASARRRCPPPRLASASPAAPAQPQHLDQRRFSPSPVICSLIAGLPPRHGRACRPHRARLAIVALHRSAAWGPRPADSASPRGRVLESTVRGRRPARRSARGGREVAPS